MERHIFPGHFLKPERQEVLPALVPDTVFTAPGITPPYTDPALSGIPSSPPGAACPSLNMEPAFRLDMGSSVRIPDPVLLHLPA